MMSPKVFLSRTLAKLNAIFGMGLVVSVGGILLIVLALSLAVLLFMNSATPNTITIASGPKGSSYQKNAEKYKIILAKQGITLKILASEGSMDNFKMLSNPKVAVDVGFVMGGEVNDANIDHLMSLEVSPISRS